MDMLLYSGGGSGEAAGRADGGGGVEGAEGGKEGRTAGGTDKDDERKKENCGRKIFLSVLKKTVEKEIKES